GAEHLGGCGGAGAFDGGFLPLSRESSLAPGSPVAPSVAELTYLVKGPDAVASVCSDDTGFCAVAVTPNRERTLFLQQDTLRAAGRLDDAADLVERQLSRDAADVSALTLLGEIELLRGQPARAIPSLEKALAQPASTFAPLLRYKDRPRGWIQLQLSYAYSLTGQPDAAAPLLRQSKPGGSRQVYGGDGFGGEAYLDDTAMHRYYLLTLASGIAAQVQDHETAMQGWSEAIQAAESVREDSFEGFPLPAGGVAEQNAALAATKLNRFDEAVAYAQAAVAKDPANPLFLETLVEAERGQVISVAAALHGEPQQSSQGTAIEPTNPDELISRYRSIVDMDRTMFSSWNNMGVLLSKSGRHDEARSAFLSAVQAKPDYGIGWFNLGAELTLHGRWWENAAAQGALGLANRYAPDLRDKAPNLMFDEEIYASGLDLSKVLPADWTLGTSARPSTTPLGIILVLVAALQVAAALGRSQLDSLFAKRAFAQNSGVRSYRYRWTWWPAWIGVVLGVFVLITRAGATTVPEAFLFAPLAVSLMVLPMAVRRLAWDTAPVEQRTSSLGLAASGVLWMTGVAWPPLAVGTRNPLVARNRTRRLLVPMVLGSICLLAVLVALSTQVPAARIAAAATAATLAAALVPVPPSEGASLPRLASLGATVFLLGVTALTTLKVI
ncbi:MAG: tetratricopeptide repeat protein, partial [Propionibacteriaceae bacterium]|nr:tetratricopeptide repeat protein [Propionibacteriaceae bacterium]